LHTARAIAFLPMSRQEDTSRRELRQDQRARKEEEREATESAELPDDERQHRRRADKAAYLEEKLAERERSERGRDQS
jgi:hypothetical protein